MIRRLLALFSRDDLIRRRGTLECRVIDAKTGEKRLLWVKKNLVVNNGLAQAALLMGDGAAEAFTLGKIGSNGTAPAVTDSALGTLLDSQSATFSRVTTTVTNDTSKWVTTHTAPGGGWTVREYGLFNASAVMWCHVTFSDINLAEANQLEFTYKCQSQRV